MKLSKKMQESREARDREVRYDALADVRIERIYTQKDDGWTACRALSGGKFISMAGIMPGVTEGDEVNVTGQWVNHPKFGPQLKVATCEVRLPTTSSGVERWLDSRLPWVGPERARQIVLRFGVPGIWAVLDSEPERLTEIDGITDERATEIAEAYRQFRVEREIMVWLYSLGLTDRITGRVVEKFGVLAKEELTANPYRLCDVDGVSFAVADKPALTIFGVPRDDVRRREAALYEVLREECFKDGHVFVILSRAIEAARKLTGLKGHVLEATFAESEKLVIIEGRFVTTKELHQAELTVVAGVRRRLLGFDATEALTDPEKANAYLAALPAGPERDAFKAASIGVRYGMSAADLAAKREEIIETVTSGNPEIVCMLEKAVDRATGAHGPTLRDRARALAGGDGAAPKTVDFCEELLKAEDAGAFDPVEDEDDSDCGVYGNEEDNDHG